jgi:hypothetical protein
MSLRMMCSLLGGTVLVMTVAATPPASAACGPWGAKTQTSSGCEAGFFCFGAGQRRTVVHYQQTRQCHNGLQQKNSTTRKCGC